MVQNITFITLGANDLNASIDFYENKLGWKRSELSQEHIIFYELNGIHLSLFSLIELADDANIEPFGSGFRGFTISSNVNSKEEVDEIIDDLRNKGVKIVKEPQNVFWGGYSSYISDPDGNLWEIAYNPFLK